VLSSLHASLHPRAGLPPCSHTGANFINYASDCRVQEPADTDSGRGLLSQHIAVTNAASLHLDAYFSCTRFGISRSTISKSPPGFEILATFIVLSPLFVVAIIPLLNFQSLARVHVVLLSYGLRLSSILQYWTKVATVWLHTFLGCPCVIPRLKRRIRRSASVTIAAKKFREEGLA